MQYTLLAVAVGMLATGCGTRTSSTFDYDFDEAQRSKDEFKIAQHIDSAGSHECWVPRSELPKATLWTNLSEPPPVSFEKAIALAAEKGGCTPDQLGCVTLAKQALPDAPAFWKYTLTFGRINGQDSYVVLMDGRVFTTDEFYPRR